MSSGHYFHYTFDCRCPCHRAKAVPSGKAKNVDAYPLPDKPLEGFTTSGKYLDAGGMQWPPPPPIGMTGGGATIATQPGLAPSAIAEQQAAAVQEDLGYASPPHLRSPRLTALPGFFEKAAAAGSPGSRMPWMPAMAPREDIVYPGRAKIKADKAGTSLVAKFSRDPRINVMAGAAGRAIPESPRRQQSPKIGLAGRPGSPRRLPEAFYKLTLAEQEQIMAHAAGRDLPSMLPSLSLGAAPGTKGFAAAGSPRSPGGARRPASPGKTLQPSPRPPPPSHVGSAPLETQVDRHTQQLEQLKTNLKSRSFIDALNSVQGGPPKRPTSGAGGTRPRGPPPRRGASTRSTAPTRPQRTASPRSSVRAASPRGRPASPRGSARPASPRRGGAGRPASPRKGGESGRPVSPRGFGRPTSPRQPYGQLSPPHESMAAGVQVPRGLSSDVGMLLGPFSRIIGADEMNIAAQGSRRPVHSRSVGL